jgi:hypothetical protein
MYWPQHQQQHAWRGPYGEQGVEVGLDVPRGMLAAERLVQAVEQGLRPGQAGLQPRGRVELLRSLQHGDELAHQVDHQHLQGEGQWELQCIHCTDSRHNLKRLHL